MALPFPDSPNTDENIADSITRIEQNLEFLDANILTGTSKIHTATRAMDGGSGDVNYVISGLTAKSLIVFASEPSGDLVCWGFFDEDGTGYCVYRDYDGDYAADTSNGINLTSASGKSQTAVWKAYNDGSIDLTWTNTGSPASATATLIILALS
jgi:hypothetical protein